MLKKILLNITKRKKSLIIIGCVLLLIAILFPFPINENHLTSGSGSWCAPSIPRVIWGFSEDGTFYYLASLPDSMGGGSSQGSRRGAWSIDGSTINVGLESENNSHSFKIRSLFFRRILWTNDGLEYLWIDTDGIPIWRKC